MTLRDVNALARIGTPVIAIYKDNAGVEKQGRIIRMRTRKGMKQVLTLGTHRWCNLVSNCVWTTK
jgi:hypothetical protein